MIFCHKMRAMHQVTSDLILIYCTYNYLGYSERDSLAKNEILIRLRGIREMA